MSSNWFKEQLRFLKVRKDQDSCRKEKSPDGWSETACGKRGWEDHYRRRWQYDKVVRSTHGVNCTGSCSWYTYSPVRLKSPLIRSALLEMWQGALEAHSDPVLAWKSIVETHERKKAYQSRRGKGGFVRLSWDEAALMIAASLVYTIQTAGPDRIFGFTPIPAMSMVCYASGARFLSLIGGSIISFCDWCCDLPPASPQVWGE